MDTFRTISKLSRETKYFWRVKAISNFATSDWSRVYSFKTLPFNAPSQVQLISPKKDTIIINPTIINFTWLQAEPDVEAYRFELSTDSSFNVYLIDTVLTSVSFSYDMTYEMAERYYWRVTARNGVGWGVSSEVWNFRFLRTFVDEKSLPNQFELYQNFPNPFNPKTRIVFEIPQNLINVLENKKLSIKIYDLIGNEITLIENEITKSGRYEIDFDAEKYNLSGGVYFYQLKFGEIQKTRKMIYLK